MSERVAETPNPGKAPALTDEQIAELTETVRADFVASAADEDEIRADHETFARWYAAVVARAKREAADEIAQAIETMPIAGFNGETLKWLKVAREMCAACARQIGATR